MCEYCGCREVAPIAELMDEHTALLDEAYYVRKALGENDRLGALLRLRTLVEHLQQHVHREETGVFTALRETGEFLDEVEALEGEHRSFDAMLEALDVESPDFAEGVATLLSELNQHVERENLGVFPVSVVTLGARGWDVVDRAHAETPTFLGSNREAAAGS